VHAHRLEAERLEAVPNPAPEAQRLRQLPGVMTLSAGAAAIRLATSW
jgi:hypothetical protein